MEQLIQALSGVTHTSKESSCEALWIECELVDFKRFSNLDGFEKASYRRVDFG